MNRAILAYGVLFGTAVAVLWFAVGGVVEGEAIARGIATGVAIFIGYPAGRRIVRFILAGELRLLDASLRRASDIAAQYSLPLREEGAEPRRARMVAAVVVFSLAMGALFTHAAALLAVSDVLLAAAGLRMPLASAICGGASLLGFAVAFGITLYCRGRIEWLAFRLSVVRGTDTLRQRAHSFERTLRLRGAEQKYA